MTSKFSSSILAIALAATLASILSACVPLVVGGAAVGAMMASDRRTSGTQVDDESIELRGASRLRDTFGDRAHINITSYNRQVLLTGEVATDAASQQAEQAVSGLENVRAIVNELAVAPITSMTQRSNDVLITGKVKASLVDAKDLYAGAYKVVTERGSVFLMGRVTAREADRATAIARNIDGVQRVVRIFDLISEEEMRRVQTQLAPTAPPNNPRP
jgi:osmotically-inducible protein OsmY